jgi:hypothetical protein
VLEVRVDGALGDAELPRDVTVGHSLTDQRRGPKTGTPEEGVDDTFILYAGPKTGH